jgi:hypothetical protein
MRTVIAALESVSPYSQSKHYKIPKSEKENAADYEMRTWRERCHYDEKGNLFMPPMAFKNCLSEVAKFLGQQIPGKGKSTYTKHFEAGIIITEGISLPVKKDKVEGEWFFVPADGRRGGGKRVEKCFPVIREWKGELTAYILDDTITADVFKYHLEQAGAFIGIGRFRPRNNGFYGRFKVRDLIWQDGK